MMTVLLMFCLLNIQINVAYAESISFTPKGENLIESSQMKNLITMIGVSVVTANLLTGCVGWKNDVIAAAVAAATFTYSEIAAWNEYKDLKFETIDGKCVDLISSGASASAVATCDTQRQSLKDMKKKYEEIKKIAEKKKSQQQIAAVAWLAAAALAAYEATTVASLKKSCEAELQKNNNTINELIASYTQTGNTEGVNLCKQAQVNVNTVNATVNAQDAMMAVPAPSSVASTTTEKNSVAFNQSEAEIKKCVMNPASGCEAYMKKAKSTLVECKVMGLSAFSVGHLGTTANPNSFFSESMEKANNFLMESAYAKVMSPWLGMGVSAMAYFAAVRMSAGPTIDLFMSSPLKRAMVWGALAGMAYLTANSAKEIIEVMDNNIKDIASILGTQSNVSNAGVVEQGGDPNGQNSTEVVATGGGSVGTSDGSVVVSTGGETTGGQSLKVTPYGTGQLNFEQSITDHQWGHIYIKWEVDGVFYQKMIEHLPDASQYGGQKYQLTSGVNYVFDSDAGPLPTKGWTSHTDPQGKLYATPNTGTTVYYAVQGDDGSWTNFVPYPDNGETTTTEANDDSGSNNSCANSTPTINEITFEGCEKAVKDWSQTATLSASASSNSVNLNYDKKNSWPSVSRVGIDVVGNAFIIYNRNCKWYGGSFEWMKPGQTHKEARNFEEMFGIKHGERVGFMVAGTIRGCVSPNVKERSNIVMTKFP